MSNQTSNQQEKVTFVIIDKKESDNKNDEDQIDEVISTEGCTLHDEFIKDRDKIKEYQNSIVDLFMKINGKLEPDEKEEFKFKF